MVDRQDIDALLISALYGELTPADEARLTAHLESHPADRSALEGLTQTRATVRESRILSVQVDPPQSISALLLQEAARRAPRRVVAQDDEQVGWFQRFVRSFMAHPAMAAAAMIIVVVGFAGIMQSRKGDHFAESTVDSAELRASSGAGSAAIVTTTTPPARDRDGLADGEASKNQDPAVTSSLKNDRGDQDSFQVDLADDADREKPRGQMRDSGVTSPSDTKSKDATNAKPTTPMPKKRPAGIEVTTPGPAPKDFAGAAKPKLEAKGSKQESEIAQLADTTPQQQAPGYAAPATGGVVGGASGTANGPTNAAPRAPVTNSPAPPPQANDKTVARNVTKPEEKPVNPTLLSWAKDKHARIVTLARAGTCSEVGKIASELAKTAPDYYNQNVANDRALKPCISYINLEREKDAERSNKSRAQKRLDANEVSPAPASTK